MCARLDRLVVALLRRCRVLPPTGTGTMGTFLVLGKGNSGRRTQDLARVSEEEER
jgi:hypothetical protein